MAKKDSSAIVLSSCPCCGRAAGDVLRRRRIRHRWIEGVHQTREYVADLDAIRCSSCGCEVIDSYAQRQKHEVWCGANGLLSPREVRMARRGLELTIDRFAALLCVGKASVGRWERGITVQSRAHDRLIRLLSIEGVAAQLANWSSVSIHARFAGRGLRIVDEQGERGEWKFRHSPFYEPSEATLHAQRRFELCTARGA
jgi:DNA-binding transcriptional regulator YiaG